MSEVLQTNAFFMITTAAVVVFTLFVCVAVIYVIQILRAIHRILRRIEEGTEALSENVASVRDSFARQGLVRGVLSVVFGNLIGRHTRKSHDTDED